MKEFLIDLENVSMLKIDEHAKEIAKSWIPKDMGLGI